MPLATLVKRLPVLNARFWRFQEIDMHFGRPLGHHVSEFEEMTRRQGGLVVSRVEFEEFLCSDFQIGDGVIDALRSRCDAAPLLSIECVDTSEWQITTNDEELAAQIGMEGFEAHG